MEKNEIEFKQAIFSFEHDEISYEVFFTPMANGNIHVKVGKEGIDKPIYSKEKPNSYEWMPSEIVAFDLLKQLID